MQRNAYKQEVKQIDEIQQHVMCVKLYGSHIILFCQQLISLSKGKFIFFAIHFGDRRVNISHLK